ncbi:response regulator [Sphingobacterium daejeonense]|uniref:response regulator n=1 Tax=Sphingobacterium daejeonense TaxID=371142 RepID=UPI0010C44662|nr:response regulator [Sphingobacterium daejeonense]VTQ07574.1 Autoinducer 2 sensor kinase/phosphatase luxQ [Sphingobacterium daejeonense]
MAQKVLRNLQLGFGFSMAVLFASSLVMFLSIKDQRESKALMDRAQGNIINSQLILMDLQDAETGQRGFLLTGREKFLSPYTVSRNLLPQRIDALLKGELTAEQYARAEKLKVLATERLDILDELIEQKRSSTALSPDLLEKGKSIMDSCRSLIGTIRQQEELRAERRSQELESSSLTTTVLIAFASVVSLIITSVLFWKLRTDYNSRAQLQADLLEKDNEMRRRLNVIRGIAQQVTQGNYDVSIDDSQKDDLGTIAQSLRIMTESLQKNFELLQWNDWRKNGLSQLNFGVSGNPGQDDISRFSLNFIVDYMRVENGALYIVERNSFRLAHSMGLKELPYSEFPISGGVLGEVYTSQRPRVVSDILPEEFNLSFAQGEIRIKQVALIPVLYQKQCLGVIEIGSRVALSDNMIQVMMEFGEIIGIALAAAQSRGRVQQLLEETQTQTEELQVQHAELENLNSELEAQANKLRVSEEELRSQQEELLISNRELENRSQALEERNKMIALRNREIQEKAEALALSTKYKSEFMANMSHELRTPLNSILLLSKVLTENNERNLNDEQIESAQVIWSSGTGLLNLIDEILDLSKIEAGKMTLEWEEFPMEDLLEDLRQMFKPITKDKMLDFQVENLLASGFRINTDRLRVEQILRNLLSNAIKFTENGSVTMRVEKQVGSKDNVLISVRDTGIGISNEKLQLIFEAFQQADGSTRRRFGGTGLGLSISREIARLLNGEITVQSEPGKGSCFSLSLPVGGGPEFERDHQEVLAESNSDQLPEEWNAALPSEGPIPEEVPDDRRDLGPQDKVLLIVEDDAVFATALMGFAREAGYKAIVVGRGDLVLRAARKYGPKAILLDIVLPIMDGWQVLDGLKSNADTKHIPVHMMSAGEAKKNESIRRGAIDFIRKPFQKQGFQGIFSKIDSALGNGPKKVLIVEENAKHAEALSYFLESFDISTEIKGSLEQSVKALSEDKVECVILDMGIPDQVAYETLETIKRNSGLEELPIIVFTGKSLSGHEEMRIKEYADSIVVKTVHSYQRILDEVKLFLHLVERKPENAPTAYLQGNQKLTEILHDRKVLIADDDIRNIFSISRALEKYNVEVVSAMDGQEACHILEKTPGIDIVLMDIMMPNMDGFQAIERIRSQAKFRDLPVIAVTAKAMIGDRERCMRAGASDYISKPVDIDQLVSLLRVWLFGR